MTAIMKKVGHFLRGEDGPTTVEYAVMIMVILLGCVTGASLIGQSKETFNATANGINDAITKN